MSGKKPNFKNVWKHSKKHADKSNKSELETSIKIGRYNRLRVQTRSDFGRYLSSGDDRVLLPNKYVPEGLSIGDFLDVFVYTDSEDRLVATTLKPAGVVSDFAFLIAKDVAPFGTFMDWGLEKDLLVPRNEQQDRMGPGKKYLVKICQVTKQTGFMVRRKSLLTVIKTPGILKSGSRLTWLFTLLLPLV